MRWPSLVTSSSLLFLAMFSPSPRPASAVGSAGFDSCGVDDGVTPEISTVNFHPYKVDAFRSPLAHRDLEFLWSDSYLTLFDRPLDAVRPGTTDKELDLLGLSICSTPGTGVFGFPVPFIRLIYDYLRAPVYNRPPEVDNYNPFPEDTLGFAIVTIPPTVYPNVDRNHADTYVYAPPFSGDPLYEGGGTFTGDGYDPVTGKAPPAARWPSIFTDADEDVSTDRPNPNNYHSNSIHIPGPRPSQVGVGGTNDWTGPPALAPRAFNHEFQHMINFGHPDPFYTPLTEIFSAAAEALGAAHPGGPRYDVPYTWGLLRPGLNYQAYQSLSAYLTYNFRGDPSYAEQDDDLVWRWARSADRTLVTGLGQQLLDANCLECANKTYFNGLSATDRVNLLLHNWRVANYVNKPSLAEGQYGYPPQFGFDPYTDLGSWQNIDLGAADSVNIEMQVKLDSSHLTRELSLAGTPAAEVLNPGNVHAMALARFGSEYSLNRGGPPMAPACTSPSAPRRIPSMRSMRWALSAAP